jgi:hypothetical protein
MRGGAEPAGAHRSLAVLTPPGGRADARAFLTKRLPGGRVPGAWPHDGRWRHESESGAVIRLVPSDRGLFRDAFLTIWAY